MIKVTLTKLKISLVFCNLHKLGFGDIINQGEQASSMTRMDDAVR